MKNIAIVGSGISGLTSAYLLSRKHRVTLFESQPVLGGHTATVDITFGGQHYAIDTGFIVFNDRTYPNFIKLLKKIGIEARPTEMSFSVQHTGTGIEYNGHDLSSLFSQRKNLLSMRFYYFLYEIVRFNMLNKRILANGKFDDIETLGCLLERYKFSDLFADHYILPMVAAIWSASVGDSKNFPFALFLRFFNNHGLLNIADRPQWYVIDNGSRSYIPKLIKNVDDVRLGSPVEGITRNGDSVTVTTAQGSEEFDEVVLACHSDQALAMLSDCSEAEREILSLIKYRENDVVLHTDTRLLPKYKASWASWNFLADDDKECAPAVTYNMNILQGIKSDETFCVTLNRTADIDPDKILRSFNYAHPVYDEGTVVGQQRRDEINGKSHTYFCGAYWYNGFHEDGVRSALDVCEKLGEKL